MDICAKTLLQNWLNMYKTMSEKYKLTHSVLENALEFYKGCLQIMKSLRLKQNIIDTINSMFFEMEQWHNVLNFLRQWHNSKCILCSYHIGDKIFTEMCVWLVPSKHDFVRAIYSLDEKSTLCDVLMLNYLQRNRVPTSSVIYMNLLRDTYISKYAPTCGNDMCIYLPVPALERTFNETEKTTLVMTNGTLFTFSGLLKPSSVVATGWENRVTLYHSYRTSDSVLFSTVASDDKVLFVTGVVKHGKLVKISSYAYDSRS